jgi:translation initiation factor 1
MNSDKSAKSRIVYQEFGSSPDEALERPVQDLPPNQQNIRIQASRKGRKGKTVTAIAGFTLKPETLNALMKQLKAQCGAGGTIEENEILIQGDHVAKILKIMLDLGYKAKVSGGK